MSYLILPDYYPSIQVQNLAAIIGNDMSKLTSCAQKAQEQCVSYLAQKYDTAQEFIDLNPYNPAQTYYSGQRVYLTATAYNAANTYLINTLTLWTDGNVYISNQAIASPEAWNPSHWNLLGALNAIFWAAYPYPKFNYLCWYKPGDKVWWKNNVYTCLIGTLSFDHAYILQRGLIQNIPPNNVWPDDPTSLQYWGVGTPYSIPGGSPLFANDSIRVPVGSANITIDSGNTVYTNTALNGLTDYLIYPTQLNQYLSLDQVTYGPYGFTILVDGFSQVAEILVFPNSFIGSPTPPNTSSLWVEGDNRCQQLLEIVVDLTLYKIHNRISPRNIPELRQNNYHIALDWLEKAAIGSVTPNLPALQPAQGGRIRYGGRVKEVQSY